METKSYTKKSLKEFIQSDFFNDLRKIPISINRAISQIENPRADEDDVLLVAQYDKDKLVGYIGALPEYIFSENEKQKCCWLTCFWVDDAYKSKNVAANLFLRIIRAWDKKILITNIVPFLEPIYQKTKIFQPTIYKSGFRGYLRFNLANILPPKNIIFQKTKGLLRMSDFILNSIYDMRLALSSKVKLKNVNYEYLYNLGYEEEDFIESFKGETWNQRAQAEINWIVSNPWIIEGAKEDKNSKRYYFSSVNKQFFYQTVKFTNATNEINGIVILNIREGNVTIPYVFADEVAIENIPNFIISTMLRLKLDMLTTYDEKLSAAFRNMKTPFYFQKEIKKPYLIAKKFPWANKLKFQDGDGDAAFY